MSVSNFISKAKVLLLNFLNLRLKCYSLLE